MIGIYIRVSSAAQVEEGYSLTAQKERLTSFCDAQGWKDYKFYIEEGRSAKNDKRPKYQELMQNIRDGKVKTVLVYRLDRIMRSIGDLHQMLNTFEEYDCAFKSATEPFDTTNATGKLFIYIVGALAQWEIEMKSERIKEVLEEKVATEGVWIGNVPYSFYLDKNTDKLVPHPIREKLTLDMIDKYKNGTSTSKIADYMNEIETTDKTWRATTLIRIFKNPALYGATRWNDKVYEKTHDGIISKDEFLTLQLMLNDRSKVRLRSVKSNYLFQGAIVCPECKSFLNVNRYIRKRSDGSTYQGAIYRCPPCAKEKKFNKTVGEQRFLDALYDYMRNIKIEHIEKLEVKRDKPDYVKQFEVIEQKRKKYQRAWASDLMDDEEFKSLMEETRLPYEDLKYKIENSSEPRPIDIDQVKNIVLMFNQGFKKLTNEEKQMFISNFIRKIKFKLIPQPPKQPSKAKQGKDKVIIENIEFY